MFKVFDKIHGFFVEDENGEMIFHRESDAQFCVKSGVTLYNMKHEFNRRWSKKDFDIIPA